MKKFLAIVFTLIFALSACTVAFAADAAPVHTCTNCGFKFDTTTDYNNHIKTCKPEASVPKTWECHKCHKVFKDEATFNEHYFAGGCDVSYTTCDYCGDRIMNNSENDTEMVEKHLEVCVKYSDNCKYCNKSFSKYSDHVNHEENDCFVRTTINNDDVSEIIGKVIKAIVNFVTTTDWGAVLAKVGEVVGGIDFEGLIGKVTGFIGGIDFEGLIGKVTDVVGNIELPAAK